LLKRFFADEAGQDLVEYALLSGIIGIAGALVLPAIADAMNNAYQSWQAGALAAWEPCPPAPAACP
jgi:Flp pilus assembly pilin Flp